VFSAADTKLLTTNSRTSFFSLFFFFRFLQLHTSSTMADVHARHDNWSSIRVLLRRIRNGSVSKSKRKSGAILEGVRPVEGLSGTVSETKRHLLVADSVTSVVTPKEDSVPDNVQEDTEEEEPETIQVHRALTVAGKGEYQIRHDFPVPTMRADEVMIRSRYVGLNPIDWKSVDYNFCLPEFPWVSVPCRPFCYLRLLLSATTGFLFVHLTHHDRLRAARCRA
jgi:hypothetical protein